MKINVVSDLHLEFDELTLPGGDVLVISGDACEAKNIKLDVNAEQPNKSNNDVRRLQCRKFFLEELPKYSKVIYVVGNHEHYGGLYDDTVKLIKNKLSDAGLNHVHVLENESVEIDDVLFIGATLWTDFHRGDPISMMQVQQGMNDYRCIRKFYRHQGAYYKLTPQSTANIHMDSKKYIRDTIAANPGKRVVVCTHHAPSHKSIAPEFARDHHMNGGYVSNMDQFVLDHPSIELWTHGHVHRRFDYMIGSTRVVCNPRGYVPYEKDVGFDPGFTITL